MVITATETRLEFHCPNERCKRNGRQRFLAEVEGAYVRVVCPSCGGQLTFEDKDHRLLTSVSAGYSVVTV